MRLTAKLLLIFLLAILLVTTVYGYLAVRREEEIFSERARNEAERVAFLLDTIRRTYGTEQFIELMQRLPQRAEQYQVRWVWFNAPLGDRFRPTVPDLAAGAAQTRGIVSVTRRRGERPYLYAYWPLDVDPRRTGGLEFSYPMDAYEAARRQAILDTLGLLAALVMTSGLMVVLAGIGMVGTPLRQLTEKTQRIAAGELDDQLRLSTGDELSLLANSLNAMCEQLRASQVRIASESAARIAAVEQLRHADRLRMVGRMASGIAHELGTPLSVISGHAELIARDQISASQVQQNAGVIKREADRMTAIIRHLLDFAREREPHRTHVEFETVVRQTLALLAPLATKHAIELTVAAGTAACRIEADVGQIQQVLTNLVMNAIQASSAGGTVTLRVDNKTEPTEIEGTDVSWAIVEVRDDGRGMSEETLDHIFDPFYTTKDVGEGTGLGLSIAHRIVEEHSGRIEVETVEGQGSLFRVLLPCVPT